MVFLELGLGCRSVSVAHESGSGFWWLRWLDVAITEFVLVIMASDVLLVLRSYRNLA